MPATVRASEARAKLADLCERAAHGERVLITRHDKPRVALVSAKDLELLLSLEDEADLELARRALARAKREAPFPSRTWRATSGSRWRPPAGSSSSGPRPAP